MPVLNQRSIMKLSSIHPKLQRILLASIKIIPFIIVEGYREKERQETLFSQGLTKTMNSKHLFYPSQAVDLAPDPYPNVDKPRDVQQIYFLIGVIIGVSSMLGIRIRIGADWNDNKDIRDDKWQDAWHIELDPSEV